MRSVVLYTYPPEPDGLSLQGDLLYRGMKESGEEVLPCHLSSEFQKEWVYEYFKPDVAFGIGFWGNSPDIVFHPQKFGVTPVPWFVADGWIANYHKELSELPLVLVTSEWVKKTYARDGVDTTNFEAVPIGCDLEVFKPILKTDLRISTIRKKLGIADDEVMIFTAGGDVTSKGAQEVLKALKIVNQEFPKWKYVCKVWGGASADDHYEDERKLIEELGDAEDKVIYLDGSFSPDFMNYMLNACDIYAAPSRLEGFGMIQMEAQACGVPVISIDEMGPKETIIHGETGFLAKVNETIELSQEWAHPHMGFEEKQMVKFDKPKIFAYRANVDEIADYLLRLMKSPDLRMEMGRKGRLHALQSFEYRMIAKRIADLAKKRLKLR